MRNCLCCLIILCLLPHVTVGQQYNFDQLSVADGLPQSQVFALEEDQRGRIWMGTQGGGVCSFDGVGFQTISTQEGLPDGYVNALLQSQEGPLYIGTRTGLSRYNGRQLTAIGFPKESTHVLSLHQTPEGDIWIGSNSGLFQLQGDSARGFAPQLFGDGVLIEDILTDQKGRQWVATNMGIYRYADSTWEHFGKQAGLGSLLVNCLGMDADGQVCAGLFGAGIVRWNGTRFQQFAPKGDEVVMDLMLSPTGDFLAGTLSQGLLIQRADASWTQLDSDDGLPTNQIRSLLTDRQGNVWIGTSGAGVGRYRGQPFKYIGRDQGLPDKQVYSLLEVGQDHWVMGMADQGVWHLRNGGKIQTITPDTTLREGKVKSLFKDSRGWIWAGTEGQGVFVRTPDTLLLLDGDAGITSPWIKDIAEESTGAVWLATSGGGLHRVELHADTSGWQVNVRNVNQAHGIPDERITQVEVDALDRVWYGTRSNGIGVVTGEHVVHIGSPEGTDVGIRSLVIQDGHMLYAGSDNSGVLAVDLEAYALALSVPAFNSQLASQNIYSLAVDGNGYLWVGTESGVDQVSLTSDGYAFDVHHFGPEQGFRGIETTANSAVRASDGKMWFGTIDGINLTDPGERTSSAHPPVLSVDQIRLFYTPLEETHLASFLGDWNQLQRPLLLTYEQNSLGFSFRGIDQRNPSGVQYRWRLMGMETDWSPWSVESSISYSNLKPGEYVFEVESRGESGNVAAQPAEVVFEILRPFWQEVWFKLAGWIALLFLVALLVYLRVRRVKRISRERTGRLRLENAVLELEQKALRLQMNPHFIFNTLNSIQGLIARKDEKTARLYLSKFGRLMRLTLENSREEMISLDQELEALQYFLDLEAFTHDSKFTTEMDVQVDAEEWMVPPLLIQPFAENAIIHGLLPRDQPGRLLVTCQERNNHLEIRVSDNGIGRAASAARNQDRAGHRSTGLQVTRERLELLKKGGEKFESVVFVDLEEGGQPVGTEVVIRVPY